MRIAEKRVFFDKLRRRVTYFCPGCEKYHQIDLRRRGISQDPDPDRPSLPGMFLFSTKLPPGKPKLCLHVIKNGRISFAKGCGHKFSGKTVEMPFV